MSWQQLSSLFSSPEFSAAITGAVLGGIITGLFSLFVQWQAARYQRKRDRETEREAVNRTLQAAATEFDTFRAKFLQALKRDFVEPDPNAPFIHLPKVPLLAQPFFAVFDSNAAVLGLVMDTALRHQIVVTYLRMVESVCDFASKRWNLARGPHQLQDLWCGWDQQRVRPLHYPLGVLPWTRDPRLLLLL